MSGCQSRYFHRSTVSPGFINHPTSSTSGRLNFKERFKRKRQRVNVILPVPNPAPRGDECVTTACSICLNNILEPAGLTCNHIFCFGCITEWARTTATTCPLCKQEFQEVVINHDQGISQTIKFQKKIQCCPDDDSIGYVSSEIVSSDNEEEAEEVPATRGRSHGYITDGFIVEEESEVDSLICDEIESDTNESVTEELLLTDEIRELLEDTKSLADRGLLLRSTRR